MLNLEATVGAQQGPTKRATHNTYHTSTRVNELIRSIETLQRGQDALPNIMELIQDEVRMPQTQINEIRTTLNNQAETLTTMNEVIQAINTRIGEFGMANHHEEIHHSPSATLSRNSRTQKSSLNST